MFYYDKVDNQLRFGDLVKGYILSNSEIKTPLLNTTEYDYLIKINKPIFSVVISPCCSIDKNHILLSPLLKIRNGFFDNPYFVQDFTRINREMEPTNTVSPEVWDRFSPEEKQRRLQEGSTYALYELFIYEPHSILPMYEVHRKDGNNINTNYYMIDFKQIHKASSADLSVQNSKVLQLGIETREELRNKIAYYFQRPAKEDLVQLEF